MRAVVTLLVFGAIGVVWVSATGCAPAAPEEPVGVDCSGLQAAVASCYQDAALAEAGGCTARAVAERVGLAQCVSPAPGADRADGWWWDFPDVDGSLNWPDEGQGDPAPEDWDILGVVQAFQAAIPEEELEEILERDHDDLLDDAEGSAWPQLADDRLGGGMREMVVEHTQGIVPVSLDVFLAHFPPESWGPSLDHYLAGDIRVYERDEEGRVVRQLERMVLNQVPYDCDLVNHPAINGDMTKVEVIVYEEDLVTVYWRVHYSENGTTESDVGSVSFARVPRQDEEHTLVTFHSAHRLRDAAGEVMPTWMLTAPFVGIAPFFEDHIDYYRDQVTDVTCSDGVDSDGDDLVDCEDPDCGCFFRPWF